MFFKCFCKLIGAGSIVPATDPFQKRHDLFRLSAFDELADPLQVAAAAADEFQIMDAVFLVEIEDDLLGARSLGRIGDHDSLLNLRASR